MDHDFRAEFSDPLLNDGAPERELTRLEAAVGELPQDYRNLLRQMNGGAGWVGEWFFRVFSVEQVLTRFDSENQLAGLVPIGSDGAAMIFGIDTRSGNPETMEYVEFDAIVLRWEEEFGRWPSLAALLQDLRVGKVT